MKAITVSAVIGSVRAKVDRSISFNVSTPELTPDEKALFFELQNIVVSLLITPEGESIPEYKVEKELTQKTPSQRLRAVLFVYWKQEKMEVVDFDQFYCNWMETFIDKIKAQLEE